MNIRRREFLVKTAALVGAGFLPLPAGERADVTMPIRVLGRTGARVSVLGYGAMQCSDAAAIRLGIDLGISYIDTADCYMGGRNEKIVGQAMAGVRNKVFVATKVHIGRERRMRASVDRSLASLNVETIDLVQLHGVWSGSQVKRKDVQQIMESMKKEGKFRFAGVTTHSNEAEVLQAVMEDGYYDCILMAVNFRSPPDLFDDIERAAEAGVGVIAMKTQNGGYRGGPVPGRTPHQAALRYVLEKPGVATAVPGMLSSSMVEENLAAVIGKGGLADLVALEAYWADLRGKACSFCSACLSQCRYGTGGLDAARVAMYAEGYKDERLAKENAADVAESIVNCAECGGCTVQCSQGIDIRAAAMRAMRYIA
jgi:aryl-alcohol dehydrogenase-like predicted oxidoreductase